MTADPSDIYNDSGVTDAVFTSVHVHAPQPASVCPSVLQVLDWRDDREWVECFHGSDVRVDRAKMKLMLRRYGKTLLVISCCDPSQAASGTFSWSLAKPPNEVCHHCVLYFLLGHLLSFYQGQRLNRWDHLNETVGTTVSRSSLVK